MSDQTPVAPAPDVAQLITDALAQPAAAEPTPAAAEAEPSPDQETPAAETPTEEPAGPPKTFEEFVKFHGVTPERAMAAINQYAYWDSPQGRQEIDGKLQQLATQYAEQKRQELFRADLDLILKTPKLRDALAQRLAHAGAIETPSYEDGEETPGWAKQILARNRELEDKIASLEGQVGKAAQKAASFGEVQQRQEFAKFIAANPAAAPIQAELASGIKRAVDANPDAFEAPGAVTAAAKRLLDHYQTVHSRLGKVQTPKAAPRPSGGGVVSKAQDRPRNEDELVQAILDGMDSEKKG